ncbi:DUF4291 family protein [Altererythrobacter xixiisoli]|uniref:DUF4291 family protein n=1 Tax=Croceibacterium xixiisoli TaxID=1476466 RepID=A0A6I4TT59_9SPHN|nr:DUF4291 domain-containing protein [Croceibacterium xixiisoli]MXO99156.1 DUF4291 family protein [Croceibacterium xixiisoli]
MNQTDNKQIRAQFDAQTIRVYQAYNDAIADSALTAGRFVSPPFSMTRMTWIKPSFLWMMYRSGWGFKDAGQNRILAIDITHTGFAWALAHSCSSHADPGMSEAEWQAHKAGHPVRVQWDPERDLHLQPQPYRAIQIGIGGEAVAHYVHEWIVRITEVTPLAHAIHDRVKAGELEQAKSMLPVERVYSGPPDT